MNINLSHISIINYIYLIFFEKDKVFIFIWEIKESINLI
jgi:hypothetical protein